MFLMGRSCTVLTEMELVILCLLSDPSMCFLMINEITSRPVKKGIK